MKKFYVQTNFFHAFTDFFQLNDPEIEKVFEMNSEKVESWHGIIISYK